MRFGRLQLLLERIVELVEHLHHVGLGGGNLVELALHVGSKLQVEDLRELLDEQVVDAHAQIGGVEAPLFLLDVAAVLDRLNDRGVRAGAADRLLFKGLDQRCFAVSGRGLGEVLGCVEFVKVERLSDRERRQQLVVVLAVSGARRGGGRRISGPCPEP